MSSTNVPTARLDHTAVWTGSEMVVWGGIQTTGEILNSGGRYAPATNSWSPTALSEHTPAPRGAHTALWTGSDMLVWGGGGGSGLPFADGGHYDPLADTWRRIPVDGTPTARGRHTAVWTGDEMIVWGGSDGTQPYPDTGGAWDPGTETWRPTAVDSGTPEGRLYHSAVWTGNEMIVWGGNRSSSMGRYCGCVPAIWYRDADGDGFGGGETIGDACTAPDGYVATSGDCDDDDARVHPGAAELCDLLDNDCDGAVDEAADASCGDGTVCTTDRCEAGACLHHSIACEDGNACTVDTCDPTAGCSFDPTGTCDHSPKGQGYWKRICDRPHFSGEFLTPVDVACIVESLTFSSLGDPEEICLGLEPDPPSDKCAQAEAQFLSLQLNLCRQRVAAGDRIQSACGGGETVGHSVEEIDTILSAVAREHEACVRAQCLAEEINSGTAIETDSLRLSKHESGVRLSWGAPYAPDRGEPRFYQVWRRRPGEELFVLAGQTAERVWDDAGMDDAEYEIAFVW